MFANQVPLVRVDVIAGPWFSLGFHIDFQKCYVDIHVVWWIITIGSDYFDYGTNGQTMREV